MNISLYHAASALSANDRWQEVIAENLASSSIPGFKRQELSFGAVQAGVLAPADRMRADHPRAFALPHASLVTSFRPGELRYTGSVTDLAIEGNGFFEVRLPNGASGYTRDGEFHISAQGQLVTKQGYVVLGDGGPLQVDLENSAPLSVSPGGEVSQGLDVKGRVQVVEFEDPRLLTQVSGGLFLANDPRANGQAANGSTVRQGWLEGANTSVVSEMANLITAMRTFEANQRVIQLQDERMAKVISELGTP
jgi:flagellar basal body rod protein FlgG